MIGVSYRKQSGTRATITPPPCLTARRSWRSWPQPPPGVGQSSPQGSTSHTGRANATKSTCSSPTPPPPASSSSTADTGSATAEGSTALGDGVRAHGWSAALPGYTLAPEASLTTMVAEIQAALALVRTVVTGPIVVSGWSAGGHLTAMALNHPAVHAALAISGLFELGPIRDTYLNEKARITDEEVATLSPLRLPVVAKPMAIAYGSDELPPLVADSRALHALRASAHAPGALIPGPGLDHFTIVNSLRETDGLLTRTLLDLAF